MAITKEKKFELVSKYVELLNDSQAQMFIRIERIPVNDVIQLRRQIRQSGGKISVVKNTLMANALQQMDKPVPEFLDGPITTVFCGEDVSATAKAVQEFGKGTDKERFEIVGGLIGTDVLDAKTAAKLVDLPSREQVLSKLLATFNAPASQLVGVLSSGVRQTVTVLSAAAGRQLVNVLQARVRQLESGEAS